MKTKTMIAAAMTAAALAITGTAGAAAPADTKVTIKGPDDISGLIKSDKASCLGNRKVILFKVVGAQGGGDDQKVASDTSERQGAKGVWSVGQPGVNGKVYAKAKAKTGCKAGVSKTIST